MAALFEQGFFVRKPAWHGLGEVLGDYPGREEAMRLAGHDFDLVEVPLAAIGKPLGATGAFTPGHAVMPDGSTRTIKPVPGFKALAVSQNRPDDQKDENHGGIIGVVTETFQPVNNSVCWDIIDAICEPRPGFTHANYETGATLDGGRTCFVTAWLDEPRMVTGDDSPIYPYAAVNWGHVGNGSIRLIRTSVREVCANTVAMAEAEAAKTGFNFTFRHTKNVMDRIEDAKLAIQGISDATSDFIELAEELAALPVTKRQREEFVLSFIPSPPEALTSTRVQRNISEAREAVRRIFDSPTIPEAHQFTGYWLLMAGTEYLDHVRGYRNSNTHVGRTLLRPEPLKAKLVPMIQEVALS